MKFLSTYAFPPVGRCIYCRTTEGDLSKEHIFPYGLGGAATLLKASCERCRTITSQMEQVIQRDMLGNLRIGFNFPTRHPDKRPSELTLDLIKDGAIVQKDIPVSQLPLMYATVALPPPRILSALPPIDRLDYKMVGFYTDATKEQYMAKHGEGVGINMVDLIIFMRFLAKIAHSFAVAMRGVDGFRPLLTDIILGKHDFPTRELWQVIGGGLNLPLTYANKDGAPLHGAEIYPDAFEDYLVVAIQLFCFLDTPIYHVVVGTKQS